MLLNSLRKRKIEELVLFLKNVYARRRSRTFLIIALMIITFSFILALFISNDEFLYNKYDRPIAKITSISEKEDFQTENQDLSNESYVNQQIKAVIKNGPYKGEKILLQNTATSSQAYNLNYKVNDEVFVILNLGNGKKIVSASIYDFKRDKYIAYVVALFAVLILLVGGFKGLRSIASLSVNILIFLLTIYLILNGLNPVLIAIFASILFIIISMLIVSGMNKKACSPIVGTLAGTLITMLITLAVVILTHTSSLGYQESDFLSILPQKANFSIQEIFFIEILIGTLGAIMDIAISISSAIMEIYNNNPDIEKKILIKSGVEIGKDIMGTMSNTLIFAYISGSIPLILILLKNNISIASVFSYYISLEIVRALTGSIGIVLSIPITIYISVMFFRKRKIGEAIKS